MLRLLLYFRCGQSQQLAPRESPQITNLPHHFVIICGVLYDGGDTTVTTTFPQLVTTTITVYDGTNALGIRYTTMVIHAIRHINHTIHVLPVFSISSMPYVLYVSFWYTTVHDTHQPFQCNTQYITYYGTILHANGYSQ